jgi:hypothetical protein
MSGAVFNMEAGVGGERVFNTEVVFNMEADVGGWFAYGGRSRGRVSTWRRMSEADFIMEADLFFMRADCLFSYANSVILCRRS